MKHTLCARPAHVCMQACAVSGLAQPSMWHLALEPFQGELAPDAPARPPPREHMHHPHIASFLDTACTTLARSSTACSSQNGSLIHRSSKRKGQGARCEQRPCPTAHNKSWWQQRCIICLATCTTLARSSIACSSQNGSLIHRSSNRKGQGAQCERRPCPTAHM